MSQSQSLPIPPWLHEICIRLQTNDPSLRNLNLNIRRLTPAALAHLWNALRENSILETLNLTNSLVPPLDLSPLVQGLSNHHSLTTLHLSYNKLVNVSLLARALRSNTCLENLFLDHNQIHHDATLLADAIKHNKTTSLKRLHLERNQINNEGAIAIADMLTVNTTLQHVNLLFNSIRAQGIASLEEALQHNVTIKSLEIMQNPGTTLTIQNKIMQWTEANSHGRYLLSYPSVPDGLWSMVIAKCGKNPSIIYFFLQAKPDLYRSAS